MSRQVVPKPITPKKQISRKEYNLRQEWAPETVKDYQVFPDELAPKTVQQQQQQPPQTQTQPRPQPHATTPANVQGRMPNRRSQVRSSSLFEEWKAKALRSPVKAQEADDETRGGTASGDAKGPLGEHSEKAGNICAKAKPGNDARGRQPEASKPGSVNEEIRVSTPSSVNTNDPIINPATTVRKRASKRGRKQGNPERLQHSLERQQGSIERDQALAVYTSPNGTRIGKAELRNLALGIKLKGKDKVYFLPCFIENPWVNLKPVPAPAIEPPQLMNRF
ncbi:hypothetical protein BDW62DRAFT_197589 [Aspergillus aurantiobrunneus]